MDLQSSAAPQKSIECSACGTVLRSGARFCGRCGAKHEAHAGAAQAPLTTRGADSRTAARPAANEDLTRCPDCGAAAGGRRAGNFCRACGYRLVASDPHIAAEKDPGQGAADQGRAFAPPAPPDTGIDASYAATSRGKKANVGVLGLATIALICVGAVAGYWLATESPPAPDPGVTASAPAVANAPSTNADPSFEPSTREFESKAAPSAPEPAPTVPAPSPVPREEIAATPKRSEPSRTQPERPPREETAAAARRREPSRTQPEPAPRVQPIPERPSTPVASVPPTASIEESLPQSAAAPTSPEPAPQPLPQGRTSVEVETAVRAARTLDELYLQRSAVECARGPFGVLCRQRIRIGLCDGRWTEVRTAGLTTCYLAARGDPSRHQ